MAEQKTSSIISKPGLIAGIAVTIFGLAVIATGLIGGVDSRMILLGVITTVLGGLVSVMWGKYGSVPSAGIRSSNSTMH